MMRSASKRLSVVFSFCGGDSDRSFHRLFCCFHHALCAPRKTVHLASSARSSHGFRIMFVEGIVDAILDILIEI